MDTSGDQISGKGIKRPHPSDPSADNKFNTSTASSHTTSHPQHQDALSALPSARQSPVAIRPSSSRQTTFDPQRSSQEHSQDTSYPNPGNEPKKDKTIRSLASSAFRNVSACNRCRLRKNRCDQRLPACKPCEKAGVKCTSFDPLLNRETPRSYVYYLESRSAYLEDLLAKNNIEFSSQESFALDKRPDDEAAIKTEQTSPQANIRKPGPAQESQETEGDTTGKLGTSGITFARVVFSAIRGSVNRSPSNKSGRNSKAETAGPDVGSMRDSVFGLQTKTAIKAAPFPDEEVALRLANLYFQHPHPQLPIIHRPSFMNMLKRVYRRPDHARTPRESYFLNIVFAIGAGIIVDNPQKSDDTEEASRSKKAKLSSSNDQSQPEEYHAAAVAHLVSVLESPKNDTQDGISGALQELQTILLLANFALLRPVAPGLWYIVGVAIRLALDLGLHHEEGQDEAVSRGPSKSDTDTTTFGQRQFTREMRRRLWWCVYSFDRLVGACVGRPISISDQVITTGFPSLLDEKYISPAGFEIPQNNSLVPSSKFVTHHYLRLRLLQSEIMQVLQHVSAQGIYMRKDTFNEYMYTGLQSPFLQPYHSFSQWRTDVDRRLWEWKESAPSQQHTGVHFSPLFYELNYWAVVIMLYRPSLTTPVELAKELDSFDDVAHSPGTTSHLDDQGDAEFVCLKIAEAGQKVLKLYRQLHRIRLINYTYLSTHALFMAGISFLYALWHSPAVRCHLSLDDVDFTVLAATSVLTDMIENCPPAEACKEAFDRMSKATIRMCMSTTGFGPGALRMTQHRPTTTSYSTNTANRLPRSRHALPATASKQQSLEMAVFGGRPQNLAPQFDMNLSDLFSEAETKMQALNRPSYGLDFSQDAQQQQVPKSNIRQTTYPPPPLSAWSTVSSNAYDGLVMDAPMHSQNLTQAHTQQASRPSSPTTPATVAGAASTVPNNDFGVLNDIHQNSLLDSSDVANDLDLSTMFDGSSIADWSLDGQDWGNLTGGATGAGASDAAGQNIDMFGGLFFG